MGAGIQSKEDVYVRRTCLSFFQCLFIFVILILIYYINKMFNIIKPILLFFFMIHEPLFPKKKNNNNDKLPSRCILVYFMIKTHLFSIENIRNKYPTSFLKYR